MNAIQISDRIDFYTDLTKSPRFPIEDRVKAVNDCTTVYIDNIIGDINDNQKYGFQSIQQVRNKLYSLIKKSTPTVTVLGTITTTAGTFTENHIDYPTDYYDFVAAWPLIDGYTSYCRPTNYDRRGPLLENTFLKPSNTKVYYNEDATGWVLTRGTGGTFTSLTLEYIKTPATYSLGATSQYFTSGTITNLLVYIACEETVYNAVTYVSGAEITGTGAALTSGRVILKSNTTTIDLPEKTHETIARMSAVVLLKNVGMFAAATAIESEIRKNN
jgi:hypothetical protein